MVEMVVGKEKMRLFLVVDRRVIFDEEIFAWGNPICDIAFLLKNCFSVTDEYSLKNSVSNVPSEFVPQLVNPVSEE